MNLGLVLSSVIVAGRPRLLMLVMSGEIWPVSAQDIQFAMPASLISPEVARKCWSPEVLDAWKRGVETDLGADGPMSQARREAIRVMRKVKKETEKMWGRLLGRSAAGGLEGVWDKWTREGRTSITAAEAAERLLNAEDGGGSKGQGHGKDGVKVKKNTLPAYAAHSLMMDRSDLFISDTGDMWKSGLFLLRPKEDRARLSTVEGWFNGTIPGGKEAVIEFTRKARDAVAFAVTLDRAGEAREVKHDLPPWTPEDRDIIAVLIARLYENRSTQTPPTTALSYLIMKAVNAYPGEQVDQVLVKRFLVDIGILSPHDSLERSRALETSRRDIALYALSGRVLGSHDLLSGTELDDVREDFTNQTVYVVDDASASELDDGISIERASGGDHWVHVHVADPTRYLRPEHPVSVRASVQGSSLYTPEGTVPLIPLGITMKELSLGATDERQGVMTFSALVSSDGSIKDENVRMGWIKSPRVITYSSVNEALGLSKTGPPSRPLGTPVKLDSMENNRESSPGPDDMAALRVLHNFAVQHRKRRYATSGFEWHLESGILNIMSDLPTLSPDAYDTSSMPPYPRYVAGEPTMDYIVGASGPTHMNAQAIVAECMILAGKIGASFCHRHGIAAPFRGSLAPRTVGGPSGSTNDVLENLLASRDKLGAIDPFRMKKFDIYLSPGELSSTLVPHWIMGLTQPETGYVRATSPLRRYEDLLVHWQIKAHLAAARGLKAPWTMMGADQVLLLAQRSDRATKRNRRAGGNADAWWRSRLVRTRFQETPDGRYRSTSDTIDLHDPVEARVMRPPIATKEGGISEIWIPSLGMSAQMAVPKSANLPGGQTIRARVTAAILDPIPVIQATLVE